MAILSWLIVGLIAGWLASVVMGTNAQQGVLMDIALGIVGALVGGFHEPLRRSRSYRYQPGQYPSRNYRSYPSNWHRPSDH